MVSRLDRLFILLDTGSNESIRLAAAKQIGEVQRVQPHDLGYLLDRIKEYSFKPSWETRIAAGHAIRCVLNNVQAWPDPCIKLEEDGNNKLQITRELIANNVDTEKILEEFDLDNVINSCPTLLSANIAGSEDFDGQASSNTSKARGRKASLPSRKQNKDQLQRQRQLINKELGMGMVDSLGVGVKSTDIVSNDDLQVDYSVESCDSASKRGAAQILRDMTNHYSKLLDLCQIVNTNADGPVPSNLSDSKRWPLTDTVKLYENGLLDDSWESRHGSAISLREIVKLQGRCAGRRSDLPRDINDKLNELWLVDMILKAICVLGLDRFSDFLFDQVVAPVRENAAQLLGCCVALLPQGCVSRITDILIGMLESANWESRHGGMLGLKYLLSVLDKDILKNTIFRIFDSIYKCLADANDDVSAESAATLVLVKDILLETIPDKTPKLIKFLWDHLAELDELSSSTSNIILLLASLLTASSAQLDPIELNKSIPRLWPLLNHPSTTVRVSVLKALVTLAEFGTRPCLLWIPEDLMTIALRLIFQRSIVENMDEVHHQIKESWTRLTGLGLNENDRAEARLALLRCTSQYLNYWFCLTMQPASVPIDRGHCLWLNIRSDGTVRATKPEGEVYIGTSNFDAETNEQKRTRITKCRLLGNYLLGVLYSNLTDDPNRHQHSQDTMKYLSDMFVHHLSTKSANQRMISAWTIESWASHQSAAHEHENLALFLPEVVINGLNSAISDTTLCYDELANDFTRLQHEAREFVAALGKANIETSFTSEKRVFYNLSQIQSMCDMDLDAELTRFISKKQVASKAIENELKDGTLVMSLAQKKISLSKSNQTTRANLRNLTVSTLSSLACAHIAWNHVLNKLGLLINPLLDSIEFESEAILQDKSIHYLIKLLDTMCSAPGENEEVIQDILNRLVGAIYSCSIISAGGDTNSASVKTVAAPALDGAQPSDEHRVLLLDSLQRRAEQSRNASRRQSSAGAATTLKRTHSQTSTAQENEIENPDPGQPSDLKIKMSGARKTLSRMVRHFGKDLPIKLPTLWQIVDQVMKKDIDFYQTLHCGTDLSTFESKIVRDLIVLQVISENLDVSLLGHLSSIPQYLVTLLSSPSPIIRHQVGQCIGAICKIMFHDTEPIIRQKIIPLLDSASITLRCGAIETIALIIEHLHLDLVPRIDSFVVHVLRRMGDQNDQVRLMATHCFGKLLSLMPLNSHVHEKSNVEDDTKPRSDDDSKFIEQLLDPKKLKDHQLPFETRVQLRSYQQEGLNWLAFLNRFNLHGILCDEMGLGKTFMTICMVASDHYSSMTSEQEPRQSASLIVCPPTLMDHWLHEIEKFVPSKTISALNPVGYRGSSQAKRHAIRSQLIEAFEGRNGKDSHAERPINLVVTSYDVLRNDIDFFKSIKWNYCVLDEGHIIKNGKTKLSRAIRLITAKHRLILSGTPIQNNVTELWSLFDFLMPGFLGSERQFASRYARPILQSRELKCSSKDLEAGALAMESLHRQVLPFILRRLKEDVLDDLPPKILQDYYCELSHLQSKLYEDFTKSKLCKEVTKKSLGQLSEVQDLALDAKSSSKSHVFQALQYLKSVCNHPKLVLSQKHPQFAEVKRYLEIEKSSLDDINHSSKLVALKQLLFDCGIGASDEPIQPQQKTAPELESVVNQHRALIFCQLKSMVEIIENDLFKKHLPNITYLRLDGSVPTNQRQSIVTRFNNDPSIDVLLLTTHIGGLGLNLTGADTVIFVEHDWNPTRDLQAMDRAHRIGQRKVVNVYRLITKDTLEEKIMGLQKFKTMVSNTVINQDNTGLATMNVDELFDLFDSSAICATDSNETRRKSTSEAGVSLATDFLPDLWDQQQYESEYNLDNFVASLKK